MKATEVKQNMLIKFIMLEFVKGNFDTKEQVSCMLILI